MELVDSLEPGVFDGIIGAEAHPDMAFRRRDRRRVAGTAVAGQHRWVAVFSVTDLQIVVVAVLLRLHFEFFAKVHFDDVPVIS